MPHRLYALLTDLDEARIHYTLARTRTDTVRVSVTVVGARVEIDVFEDGRVEVSEFRGSENAIEDEAFLTSLIEAHRD